MPRPRTKKDLIIASTGNFSTLLEYIDQLAPDVQQREFPAGTANRNIRDILTHLHHWHLLMMDWYEKGMQGIKPDMPATGYTWRTTSALNAAIRRQYQNTKLDTALDLVIRSHKEVHGLILQHTDEELFEKKRYHWTGSTSLGAYLISSTSSHYDWALKLIRKATKGN